MPNHELKLGLWRRHTAVGAPLDDVEVIAIDRDEVDFLAVAPRGAIFVRSSADFLREYAPARLAISKARQMMIALLEQRVKAAEEEARELQRPRDAVTWLTAEETKDIIKLLKAPNETSQIGRAHV